MELVYSIIMILMFIKYQAYVCRLAEKSVAGEKEKERENEKEKEKEKKEGRERERKRKKDRYGITCALKRRSYSRRARIIDARFTGDFIRSTIFGDNDRQECSPAVSIENRCVLYSTKRSGDDEQVPLGSARLGA